MQTSLFNELSLIIVIGAGMALIMRLLKQPLIIGHILTGIIVGPTLLHIVQSDGTIDVFAKIGIALLLFIIGLGLNPRIVRDLGKVAGISGSLQILFTGVVGYVSALVLGRTRTESLFVAVALAFSSTIIILKLLSDKKEQTRLYGKISIGILLIQDIVATLALIFTTAQTNGHGVDPAQLALLVIKGIWLATPLFLISGYVLPRMRQLIAGSQEFLFLFAIGWGFGAAALFEHFGFSVEIGALFAGVALAGLPYAQEIGARLRPLRDFFVIVFFISLGTRLTGGSLNGTLVPVLVFSFIVLVIKPLIVMTLLGAMRYTKRTSFKAATSLAQISEFSLVFVILGASHGLISNDLVSIITLVALITITISSYLIVYSDKLYELIAKRLTVFERHVTHAEHDLHGKYELVLFGYKKGGAEFVKVFKQLGRPYIIIDYDPDVIETLEHHQLNYVYGDATDIEFLEEFGLEHARLVVSTIGDFPTNEFLANWLENNNMKSVYICSADNAHQASDLYNQGVSYVMLPHYIGSEKIGAFIKKSGLSKTEFRKFREKHLAYIATHFDTEPKKHHEKIGRAILDKLETPIPVVETLEKLKPKKS